MSYRKTDLQIVLSHGQSLSIGIGANRPISTEVVFPGSVLTLGKGSGDQPVFEDLIAKNYEAPLASMLNTIAASFSRDGVQAPTLVGTTTGKGGTPLIALTLSSNDRRSDIPTALETTESGAVFYIFDADQGVYNCYFNQDGKSVTIQSLGYEPNLFDNITETLQNIKLAADHGGLTITDDVVFSFIHGQANARALANISYSQQLSVLVNKIDSTADRILQKDVNIISVIGQTRDKYPASEQLRFVANTESSYLGALEFQYQAENPGPLDWRTGILHSSGTIHLNEIGYSLLGQETGNTIYGALTKNLSENDLLKFDSLLVDAHTIILTISGLKGEIISDTSIFGPSTQDLVPRNFGFTLIGDKNFHIVSSVISGANEITITLDRAVDTPLSLVLGNGSGFQSGTLRDSVTAATNDFFDTTQIAKAELKKFIPFQTMTFDRDGQISGTFDPSDSGSIRRALDGSPISDQLVGTLASEVLDGGAGNDTLDGSGGHDLLRGGRGADVFRLSAPEFTDTIVDFSPEAGDLIDLGSFFRVIITGLEMIDDFICLSTVNETTSRLLLDADGNGDDFQTVFIIKHPDIQITLSDLVINGNLRWDQSRDAQNNTPARFESVNLTRNADIWLASNNENHLVDAFGGNDSITGGNGQDTVIGGTGNDTINTGAGDDTIRFGAARNGFDVINGGAGTNDRIEATAANIRIGLAALAGIEVIDAGGFANVQISGNAAANSFDFSVTSLIGITRIDVGFGNDTVIGSTGDDVIVGGLGGDTLRGNGGNDIFQIGALAGTDTIFGGTGSDRIEAVADRVTLIVTGANIFGVETIASAGFAEFKLQGTVAADRLDFSDVTLSDIALINGGFGNDTITGSAGADVIAGGFGRDRLTGGAGADTFLFGLANHSRGRAGSDEITDFLQGQDRIDVSAIDANTQRIGNDPFTFIGGAAFGNSAGQLRIDTTSVTGATRVLADIDGNGSADFEVRLTGTLDLQASDFVL